MNQIEELFETLWKTYTKLTPQASKIKELFENTNNQVLNDHIALRTFNNKRCDISKISEKFISLGYIKKESYTFEKKKLNAIHLEKEGYPLVFISQIKMEEFSKEANNIISEIFPSINYSPKD
jgi:hypothetical protein